MKKLLTSEKLFLDEVSASAHTLKRTTRGLSVGAFIKLIRTQLKMSQEALAKRAGVPQSTISRIEKDQKEPPLPLLNKIYAALSCNLVVAPMLNAPLDEIRQQQAKRVAKKHSQYLRGTMNLEKQTPDKRLLDELIKHEENELLHGSGAKLWEK